MTLTPADIASPDHYLHSFDGDEAVMVRMDRAAYRRSIFLDGRISVHSDEIRCVPVRQLVAMARPAPRTAWIFHMAHCGSTLLARALDELSDGLVLREPLALRQVAMDFEHERFRLVLSMVGRRYGGEVPTLVKANVPVNRHIGAIAASDPAAPALLLYARLEDYLLAIMRSDVHLGWLQRITDQLSKREGFGLASVVAASNAVRAASLWWAQIRLFVAALDTMPAARTLEAARFYAHPADVLARAARHLGRSAEPARLAEVVAGPLFRTYSKQPGVAFDNAARLAREAVLRDSLAGELAAARQWIAAHAPDADRLVERLAAAAL